MAIKKTINIDVKTQQAQKNVKDLSKETNKASKDIKGNLEGSFGVLDKLTGGAISKFKSFKGTLGGVSKGFKGIGVAIAASGIGLLATIIGSIITAFKSSEEGQNKFAKLMGIIGSVLGNVTDIISDFGEKAISAIENPGKAWDNFKNNLNQGYQFIKKQMIDRFSSAWTILSGGVEAGILKMRVKWNEFTGDAEEAEQLKTELKEVQEEVIKATEVIKARNQEIVNGFNAAIEKVKEFGREVAEDAKKAQKIADQRAAAEKQERALIVARAKADRDVANFRDKAANREKFNTQERIKFLEQAAAIEQAITAREIQTAQLLYNAKVAENALSKSTKEDLKEEAQLKANVIQLETKSLTLKKALTAQISALTAQQLAADEAERKRLEDKAAKEKEIELKRLEDIQAIRDEFKQKIEDLDAEDEQAKLDLEEQRKLAELDALNATEQQKSEVRQYYDKLQTELEKEQSEERIANALAEKEAKAQILNAQANLAIQFGQFLQQLGEENKALAITGIVVEQIASVAKIISNTGIANAKALAASPLTGGQPWIAINTASAGLSIASSVLSASKAISKLGGGGGGLERDNPTGGGGTNAPTAPSFNLIGQGGLNQVAQSLNQQNGQPIKAYVVSKDVSTNQELDRNIEATATLG
ncbi:hypothetical protein [Flagellimonas onchidii]|uniref:hypothetical protein n=1 Tax=Flagellimonas onchidii TaxID=2562684 RepID=UPI0010A63F72|nr:hypothetical protein [Allomuricauda onchidii]